MKETDWRRVYDCCYDNLSAIIAYYIAEGAFKEEGRRLNDVMEYLNEIYRKF